MSWSARVDSFSTTEFRATTAPSSCLRLLFIAYHGSSAFTATCPVNHSITTHARTYRVSSSHVLTVAQLQLLCWWLIESRRIWRAAERTQLDDYMKLRSGLESGKPGLGVTLHRWKRVPTWLTSWQLDRWLICTVQWAYIALHQPSASRDHEGSTPQRVKFLDSSSLTCFVVIISTDSPGKAHVHRYQLVHWIGWLLY